MSRRRWGKGEKARDAGSTAHKKRLLNGIYFDEIQAPKPEFHDPPEQGTRALAHPRARRSFAVGLATRLAPPVRPRAGVRARESEQRAVFLRVSGHQSCFEIQ